jgi:LysM repeat protein
MLILRKRVVGVNDATIAHRRRLYHFPREAATRRFLTGVARVVIAASLAAGLVAITWHPASVAGGFYAVEPGDTIAAAPRANGTSAAALTEANGQPGADRASAGRQPEAAVTPTGTAPAAAATPAASGGLYAVKRGDTLAGIARSFGVSASSIIQANGIANPNLVYINQNLVIPGGSSRDGAPASAPLPAGSASYVVQAGDTLAQLARRYDTTVAAIVQANGLASPDLIWLGMRLVMPAAGSNVSPTPAGQATRLEVSISQQHCWLYQGDAVIGSWACSTGRAASPTPPGSFHVQSKLPRAYGSAWNIMMPYWLGIYWAGSTENGIHGLPWNATTGARTWDGLVGTPITYGCVMLNDAAAKLVWDMAYIGMPVIIRQ